MLTGLICSAILAPLLLTDAMERLELRTQDVRFRVRGPRPTRARIVIATIQNSTLDCWKEPKVAWGTHYAALIQRSLRAGATAVGFDVIQAFDTDSYLADIGATRASHPNQDFARALELAGGRVALSDVAGGTENARLHPMFRSVPRMEERVGVVNMPPQRDESARTARLRDHITGAPSLAAVLAQMIEPKLRGHDAALPPTGSGAPDTFWINYTNTKFPRIPAERLADGVLTAADKEALRGAVVLLGVSYAGSNDAFREPPGHSCLGVEVNAQALATIVDRRPLTRWPALQECLVTSALALALLAGTSTLPFLRGLVLTLFSIVTWSVVSQHQFTAHDLLAPTAAPLISMTLPFLALHSVRALEEKWHRLQIARLFGNYVGLSVRDYVLSSPERQELGGDLRDVTVLFFDIRGFTAFSQSRQPTVVLEELNALFGVIAPVIDARQGLISKYTGDGLLAIFGAPAQSPDHAQEALSAARGIVAAVDRENVRRSLDGRPPWRIGCSINSGACVCGNLGVEDRVEYTVIGDTVNLTARLEEFNKTHSSTIVLSHSTYQRLASPVDLEGPLTQPIRGREGQVAYYIWRRAKSRPATGEQASE